METLEGHPGQREGGRETHGSSTVTVDVQYGGLVRASARFRGWRESPEAKRTDGRIPYESTERAERHGRVRCQAMRGIEITDQGTFQITGMGELHIVGGVRRRVGWSVREVSIQERNIGAQNEPEEAKREREFIVLMTLTADDGAEAPRAAPERPAQRTRSERNEGAREYSGDEEECGADERQNRWTRRKGQRHKQGSAHGTHPETDGRQKGRLRNKGRDREWDAERY